jgi:hypothetical protein
MTHTVKIIIAMLGFAAIAVFTAATASADEHLEPPPPPSGTDVSSWGTVGDPTDFGLSAGDDGYQLGLGPDLNILSRGWPVSQSTVTGTWGTWDSTTDYDYEGGIEHWSRWDTDDFEWDNWYELTPDEYNQESLTRIGSMSYRCIDNVCEMVPTGTP